MLSLIHFVANQQRKSQIVHETHGQIQKMPKMTPQELSKLKADKDAQTAAEIRRRQEEARQQLAARNNPSVCDLTVGSRLGLIPYSGRSWTTHPPSGPTNDHPRPIKLVFSAFSYATRKCDSDTTASNRPGEHLWAAKNCNPIEWCCPNVSSANCSCPGCSGCPSTARPS